MTDYYETNRPTSANYKDILCDSEQEQHFPSEGLFLGNLAGGPSDLPALADLNESGGICFLYKDEADREKVNTCLERLAWRLHSKEKHYWRNPNNKELQEYFTEIEKVGYASHKSICLRKHFGRGLRFEHVVPFNLVIERLDELNRNGELSFDRFMQIKSKLNICIITEDENRRLDKYRQHFPNDVDWENGNEFARYDTVGIDIHGR